LYGKPVNYPTIPLVQVVKPLDRRLRNFTVFRFGNRARQMIRIEKKPTPKDAKDLQSLASMLAPQFWHTRAMAHRSEDASDRVLVDYNHTKALMRYTHLRAENLVRRLG